jgi:hypothetical protein
LVQASELIIVGTVGKVLPAFNPDPQMLDFIETDSLVSIDRLLNGQIPPGTSTITLAQIGEKVGPCTLVVPKDPLVTAGEQYVLFLIADNRKKVANTTGAPRYYVLGVWSGKAKMVNGKVNFLPSVSAELHKSDGTDAGAFIDTVISTIKGLGK